MRAEGAVRSRSGGTLIRHARREFLSATATATAIPLGVSVIEPPCLALAVTSIGPSTALAPGGLRASRPAVDLAPIAGAADHEPRVTAGTDADAEALRTRHRQGSTDGRTRGDPEKMRESGRRASLPSAVVVRSRVRSSNSGPSPQRWSARAYQRRALLTSALQERAPARVACGKLGKRGWVGRDRRHTQRRPRFPTFPRGPAATAAPPRRSGQKSAVPGVRLHFMAACDSLRR